MSRTEHLSCLRDAGQIESIGRFVTQLGETIEVGLCPFDGDFSGFRCSEERGWEPIFVRRYDAAKDADVVSICAWTEDNSYSEEEIAVEFKRFLAERRTRGSA